MPLTLGTFTTGTAIVNLGFNVYTHLSSKARNSSGHKRLILRELRENIRWLDKRDIVNIEIPNLLRGLDNAEIVAAIRDNYNLNRLARRNRVVSPDMTFRDYEKSYINDKIGDIIDNIDERIADLHQIVDGFENIYDSQHNITSRLNNLFHLCLIATLLTRN